MVQDTVAAASRLSYARSGMIGESVTVRQSKSS